MLGRTGFETIPRRFVPKRVASGAIYKAQGYRGGKVRIMNLRHVVLAALALLSVGSASFAASYSTANSPQPRPIVWVRSPFAGITVAYVQGDWSKPGALYTARYRMHDGAAFPPHYHASEEVLTVISGVFVFKPGTELQRTGGREFLPGTVLVIPANFRHFGWARGETVIQISGLGPHTGFVVPASAPARR